MGPIACWTSANAAGTNASSSAFMGRVLQRQVMQALQPRQAIRQDASSASKRDACLPCWVARVWRRERFRLDPRESGRHTKVILMIFNQTIYRTRPLLILELWRRP